jgi:hypothetical protein
MPITQLDTENADRDITSLIAVLTDTPDVTNPTLCQAYVKLGDGAKNLDGSGGNFNLVITVGGQTVQASPQVFVFGTEVRSSIWSSQFPVPANEEVIVSVLSPNAADTDVDVIAYLYDVSAGDAIAISGSTATADNVESVFLGTGSADDVDLSVRSLIVSNDSGTGLQIVGTTQGLQVVGTSGNAATLISAGGDGDGLSITANGFGQGIDINATSGDGVNINSTLASGMSISGAVQGLIVAGILGDGVLFTSIGGNGNGLSITGNGTGADLSASEIVTLLTLTDANGEPGQGLPPVSTTMIEKVDYLYKNWRNKKEQTGTLFSLYNDAETVVDQKADISEIGGLFTKGEMESGA